MANGFFPRGTAPRSIIRLIRLLMLVLFGWAMLELPGRADVIILKDGYTIHGKVLTEQTILTDKNTGQEILTRKLGGLTLVDDGPRYTIFSASYRRLGDVSDYNKFADNVSFVLKPWYKQEHLYRLPNQGAIDTSITNFEFNKNWQRKLYFRSPEGRHEIVQQITTMTPHYINLTSTTHQWQASYLTREKDSATIRKWIALHPDQIEKNGPDTGKRSKLIRFLIQADWLSEAEEEIDRLAKDLPGETKRAEEFREEIRTVRVERQLAEIERAKESGRHSYALSTLKLIPKNDVPAKLTLKIAALKAEYDASLENLEKARRYLKQLQKPVGRPAPAKDLAAAAEIILSELHLDTTSRLNDFIALAEQAEMAIKGGQTPRDTPDVLLSAAVTGWLMGRTEIKVDVARKELKAREMALKYLRSPAAIKRNEIVAEYEKGPDALPFDEIENLISLLPPPAAESEISTTPVFRKTGPVPELAGGTGYLLQLPPEYQHGRPYPLLILLPRGGERMMETLKRLGDHPARNGMIVAVADWNNNGTESSYTFSEAEHASVTGLLRHLRRTLQVDSDRVFLMGYSEGASMALDLGASHPDLFAGVVTVGPTPEWQYFLPFEYWKNFQNLPIYLVTGDLAGASVKTIRHMLENWMPKGYPAIAVTYKGRSAELFHEELPNIFDWMSRKTRITATPDLGRSNEEFRTVRATSNRFYWISLDEIDRRSLFDTARKATTIYPAWVRARIIEGNRVAVEFRGMNQMSIWLGKGMVDYTKPVTVTLGTSGNRIFKKQLSPKLSVLLEDLYERGDRQRPFYQRIDCRDLDRVTKFTSQ